MLAALYFSVALAETALFTWWPLSTVTLRTDALLVCLISTFIAIPASTFAFLLLFATNQDNGIWVWQHSVLARRALISTALLSRELFASCLLASCLLYGIGACCRRAKLEPVSYIKQGINSIFAFSVICMALADGLLVLVMFLLFINCYPFQDQRAKGLLCDMYLFWLYCISMLP
tara:strand:- start:9173 stop:9697 length:525 start_codon:yes stop_codon:yes gene_type:complete